MGLIFSYPSEDLRGDASTASRGHRVDAIAAFIHDTASKPVDRLVAVEGDDRAALVAVDAPAEVDVVAQRAAPVLFGVPCRMGRMGSFLR